MIPSVILAILWITSSVHALAGLSKVPVTGFIRLSFDASETGFNTEVSGSGEVIGSTKSQLVVKTLHRENEKAVCRSIQFDGIPVPNDSPLVGPNAFNAMPDEVNGKTAYTNGHEWLSFIAPTSDHSGTWIVGVEPGVDSGYVFLRVDETFEAKTPVGAESSTAVWHWLQKGNKWQEQRQLRIVCIEEPVDEEEQAGEKSEIYAIEYFKGAGESSEAVRSTLVVNPTAQQLPYLQNQASNVFSISELQGITALLLDQDSERWLVVDSIDVIAELGASTVLTPRAAGSAPFVAHYITDEHGWNGAWRVIFHRDRAINNIPDGQIYTVLVNIDSKTGVAVDETYLDVHPSESSNYMGQQVARLQQAEVGDYLWLFVSDGTLSNIWIDELFLECVATNDELAVFRYQVSDRRETMDQPILTRDTDYVVIHRAASTGLHSPWPKVIFQGKELVVHGAFNLGKDLVGHIKNFLITTEGFLSPTLSSCYFYHAAVSLPKALVYAAEILCVLVGAKPLTLIQYTSPSDHQWKHMLVRELSSAIVQAKHLWADELDVEYRVTKYGKDESLVIYRTSRQYIFNSLLPVNQSQALHPAPYPDRDDPKPDEEKQIYYAWWNGFVLGYPEHFVDSYCETFHNSLTAPERAVQMKRAKRDVYNHFRTLVNNNRAHQHVLIKMGLDPSVGQNVWDMLQRAVIRKL